MKEIFYLDKPVLPTIPVPHDFVIKEIRSDEENLYFVFEDDISYHDSAKEIRPNARSLIIRFHLPDGLDDVGLYFRKRPGILFHRSAVFVETPQKKLYKTLVDLPKERLEYLYHNVGYRSVIVRLWSFCSIVLELDADYVEFEWIE